MRKTQKEILLKKAKASKRIDSLVSAIMIISGIFLFASFITAPEQSAVQGAQLAPPMPTILLTIVGLLLIAGVVYFMITRVFRKKDI